MRSRHPSSVRLLKYTVVAIVLATAFAGTANADLGLSGASDGVPAPVSTTLTSASPTLTGTLEGTASPPSEVLGTAQSTVAEIESTLDATADATLESAAQTVEQVGQSASSTVPTLGQLVETADSTTEKVAPAVSTQREEPARQAVLEPRLPPSARDQALETVARAAGVAQGERTLAPTVDRPRLPTARAGRAPGTSMSSAVPPAPSDATPRRSAADAQRLAAPLQQPPDGPAPGDPLAPLQALLQAPSVGALLMTGALLGVLLLSLSRGVGPRLRPTVDLFRPPDVFFRLERPG